MNATPADMVMAALDWHQAGACILPVAADGTKRPALKWDRYKSQRPDVATLTNWAMKAVGIGMVCGQISGNVEMLEAESTAVAEELHSGLLASLPVDLMEKLLSYTERSPSGGMHWIYRVEGEPVRGNTKLARRRKEDGGVQVLLETRGEGGWTVLAPSGGAAHPTGESWQRLAGTPDTIPTLTAAEYRMVHTVAATFDEMGEPEVVAPRPAAVRLPGDGAMPGEDFEARVTWEEILIPAGWQIFRHRGEITDWTRPGKSRREGVSATTGWQGDWLYVFTTSTEFESERTYTKLGAWTVINAGGDYSVAAGELRKLGYGAPATPERKLTLIQGDGGTADGNPSVGGASITATNADFSPATGLGAAMAAHPAAQPAKVTQVTTSFTDRGNAGLMVGAALAKGEILYSPKYKAFYTWRGNRWMLETSDDITPAVQLYNEVIDSIAVVGSAADAIAKHKLKSMSWHSARDAIQFFKATPDIQVSPDDMDNRPLELNTPAGVVNLLTGEFHTSTPADRHTRLAGVSPDFTETPHKWLAFLDETFGGDAEMIGYIQRLAGYSMTGSVTHEVMPFLYGSGANGKSVLLVVLAAILGDYASSAPPDFLLARTTPAHETEIARLHGQRFVICSEVPHNARFNEGRMKMLCSQEDITGHFMGKDHITFRPSHHLWLAGNHEPSIPGGGNGFWRRFRKIPFHHTVPAEAQDPELAHKLVEAEGPAIMAWMISGSKAQSNGLADPPEVLLATEEYASSEDQLGRFLTECIKAAPGLRVETKDVSNAYNHWLMVSNERPAFVGPRLGRELKARGFVRQDSSGKAYYRDVVLLNPESEPDRPTQEEMRYGK